MNDHVNQRMRQIIHELSDNSPSPHEWDQIANVRPEAPHLRSPWLVIATAALAVVGVVGVVGVVAVGGVVTREPSTVSPELVGTPPETLTANTSATGASTTENSSTHSSPTPQPPDVIVGTTIELATPTTAVSEPGPRTVSGRYDCGPTDQSYIYASVLLDTTTSVVAELFVGDELLGRSGVTRVVGGTETEIGFDLELTPQAFAIGEGLLRVRDLEAATAPDRSELRVTVSLRLPEGRSCG